jgi:hypothetical protein
MLRRITVFCLLMILAGGLLITAASSQKNISESPLPLVVTVSPSGPSQATVDATKKRLMIYPSVKTYVKGTRNRILSFEMLDNDAKVPGRPLPPDRFRAVIYSYDNNKAILAEGRFDSTMVEVTLMSKQPEDFSQEEFDEAVAILSRDAYFGPLVRNNALKPYRPMPAIAYADKAQGTVERTVNVGLASRDGGQMPEIVGVNMVGEKVVRFPNGAPKTALATPTACGLPGAGQATTSRGIVGQYDLTITQGPTTIWQMTIIRPSASSGTRASGVELRNVDFRGKRVFARAHAPILNVQYVNNACGPYRDWQYQEGMFAANPTTNPPGDVAPGIRICSDLPQTILDNGTDTGNFRGVAIYTSNGQTTIVSEMEAGWYRYISEWHFFNDGTIQPRFGFGGVTNSCVCNDHNHHVYWRFDFDVAGASPNVVYGPASRWWPFPIASEVKILRSTLVDNRLNIQNLATGDTYTLSPGRNDGTATGDTFARGDVWILARDPNGGELDDGHNSTSTNTEIDLDQFVNGQNVQGADIVVWYGAHFLHTVDGDLSHKVGPEIVPLQW